MIQICLTSKASDQATLPNEFRNSHARFIFPDSALAFESNTVKLSPIADSFVYVKYSRSNYGTETPLLTEYEGQITILEAKSSFQLI
jgi:hypothetical protein